MGHADLCRRGFLRRAARRQFSDLLAQAQRAGRTWASGTGLLLTVPALIGLGFAPNLPLARGVRRLYGLGFGMFDANNMPILCQVAPARFRATGYGLMNFAGIAAGAF